MIHHSSKLDGVELAKYLQTEPDYTGIPCVVMGAARLSEHQIAEMQAAQTAYLVMPKRRAQLLAYLTAVLGQSMDLEATTLHDSQSSAALPALAKTLTVFGGRR